MTKEYQVTDLQVSLQVTLNRLGPVVQLMAEVQELLVLVPSLVKEV